MIKEHFLLYSSLSSASDKTSYSFQLFKIYQQYPDSLLRSVMNQLRARKMVSLKKTFKRDLEKRSVVPLSSRGAIQQTLSPSLNLCRNLSQVMFEAF